MNAKEIENAQKENVIIITEISVNNEMSERSAMNATNAQNNIQDLIRPYRIMEPAIVYQLKRPISYVPNLA